MFTTNIINYFFFFDKAGFSKTHPSFLNLKFFLKSTRPSLPLKKAPPLISVFSPQGKRGNRPTRCSNRFAIWLADHQRSTPAAELRFFVRDEPALLKSFLWERRDTNKYLLLWDRIAGIAADRTAGTRWMEDCVIC